MPLTGPEFIRYNRHIMVDKIAEQGQAKLKNSKVLIIGMGGLGCPAAQYLAASGVGELTLVDMLVRFAIIRENLQDITAIG